MYHGFAGQTVPAAVSKYTRFTLTTRVMVTLLNTRLATQPITAFLENGASLSMLLLQISEATAI